MVDVHIERVDPAHYLIAVAEQRTVAAGFIAVLTYARDLSVFAFTVLVYRRHRSTSVSGSGS